VCGNDPDDGRSEQRRPRRSLLEHSTHVGWRRRLQFADEPTSLFVVAGRAKNGHGLTVDQTEGDGRLRQDTLVNRTHADLAHVAPRELERPPIVKDAHTVCRDLGAYAEGASSCEERTADERERYHDRSCDAEGIRVSLQDQGDRYPPQPDHEYHGDQRFVYLRAANDETQVLAVALDAQVVVDTHGRIVASLRRRRRCAVPVRGNDARG